jgi:hypothetical protein
VGRSVNPARFAAFAKLVGHFSESLVAAKQALQAAQLRQKAAVDGHRRDPSYGRQLGTQCPILLAKQDQVFPIGFRDEG